MSNVSKLLPAVARILFGLMFVVFGANAFLHFLPDQPPPPPAAASFVGGLFSAGYFLILLKSTEIVSGLLLLSNRFVPLALVLLAPIVVNIAAFHFILAPAGAGMAVVVLALEIFLAWSYRSAYAPLFVARAPLASASSAPASKRQAEPALAS